MDHLAMECQKKLETFRIKELKDVLSRIGAAKQGKKQVLVEKIMAIFLSSERGPFNPMGLKVECLPSKFLKSREDVVKVIDEVYRTRQFGAPDLATRTEKNGMRKVPVGSAGLAQSNEVFDMPNGEDSKTRCPCGSPMDIGNMIQCESPGCMAWQHVSCVIISEKENIKPEIPPHFFCEVCRIQNGDPFCVSISHPLLPMKTMTSIVYGGEGGSNILQTLEASFTLTYGDWELLQNPICELQIWCVLLGDEVAFRMHWPLKADLRINGVLVRVTNRPGHQKLGANGRDDGPVITDHTREGLNRISFTAFDGRSFCIGVRIIQRLTVAQVMSRIPSEAQGENSDTALSRVRRCIAGGGSAVDDDSDSDLEVISEFVTVNLRCPLSGSRMNVPGRFKPCMHMGCFDLNTFVELNQRARKWQCPICLKNYSLQDLIIDPFFAQITRALKGYDEDVAEVEMKPDGCWRPKLDADAKCRESWRSPEGLVSSENGKGNLPKAIHKVKVEEGLSTERLPFKIGFKRTQDGYWKADGTFSFADLSMSNNVSRQHGLKEVSGQNSMAACSYADSSVNQGPIEGLNYFRREEIEVSSCVSMNAWPDGLVGGDAELLKASEIIVLSDTEENYAFPFTTGTENLHVNPITPMQENVALFNYGGNLPQVNMMDFLGTNREAWAPLDQGSNFPTTTQGTFELLTSGSEVGMEAFGHRSSSSQAPLQNGAFNLLPMDTTILETSSTLPSGPPLVLPPETNVLETSFIFCHEEFPSHGPYCTTGTVEPNLSLRNLLPHQPARSAVHSTPHEPGIALDDGMQDGWFSLSLGGGQSISNPTVPSFKSSRRTTQLNSLVESGSVTFQLSSHGPQVDGNIVTPKDITRACPRQPAAYEESYLCIDSDSN